MPPLGIAKLDKLPRFKKAYKKLDPEIRKAADKAISDLLESEIPPGRKLKKHKANREIWTIRVNRDYRLSFELDGSIAILRNIAEHDQLYDAP